MEAYLWSLYRQMLRSRRFEEAVMDLWEKGEISGEMHVGIGEEAVGSGVVAHLQEGDAMALDHRGTPPLVARGVDLVLLLRELLGRADGLCSGMGGHMHLFSAEHLAASSGIVGATGPLAVGFALAAQHLRPRNVAVAFFGEGAINQGMLMESLNLAVVWKLPVLFVCKDNEWAISTRSNSVTGGNLIDRAKCFGMPALEVDGTDVEEVWKAAGSGVERARNGDGPAFLLAHCPRLEGHFLQKRSTDQTLKWAGQLLRSFSATRGTSLGERVAGVGKVLSSVSHFKSTKRKSRDPILRMRHRLSKEKTRLDEVEKEVEQEIRQVVQIALSSP